jgi:hypothetical protein
VCVRQQQDFPVSQDLRPTLNEGRCQAGSTLASYLEVTGSHLSRFSQSIQIPPKFLIHCATRATDILAFLN